MLSRSPLPWQPTTGAPSLGSATLIAVRLRRCERIDTYTTWLPTPRLCRLQWGKAAPYRAARATRLPRSDSAANRLKHAQLGGNDLPGHRAALLCVLCSDLRFFVYSGALESWGIQT